MASTLHHIAPPPPPPNYSRPTTATSLPRPPSSASGRIDNPGASASQSQRSQMAYFPRPSQAHSDVGLQPPSSQGYGGEMNGVMHHGEPHRPQIYTAIYSGVPVYEMEVNQVAVMRRRADSWLNATQILKVAGVDKGKRTKVLEKEILVGEHEKVQGGYGKYQGTWINYQRGVEFCRQYGVEQLLKPLLEYDMGQDGANAGQGGIDTPTKEQAMAAQRKRLYNAGIENRSNGQSANGTFFKNISSTASNAVAAINKARFDSPGPRSSSANRRPQSARRPSFQQGSQESGYPGSSLQSMPSFASESSFGGNGSQNGPFGPDSQDPSRTADMQEPPRKRPRQSTSVDVSMQAPETSFDVSMRDGTPTEPNESFLYQQDYFPNEDDGVVPLEPLPRPTGKSAEEKIRLLTSLFLDPLQTDFTQHPAFTRLSRPDLDLPLDPTAHTALHWAATLARLPLLKALISRGASIFRVNGGGETALIRACVVTNNLDHGSFPELLELLGPTIEMRDGRGRTVLHHIAVSSAVKGRSAASRYYLESLLEFVVRQGSAPSSQQNSFHASATPVAMKAIGLGRFMSEIVNAQDKSGDTALNIAARIGNKSIIHQLIEVGADAGIPNRAGLKPSDFGIGDEADAKDPTLKETVDGVDGTVSKVVSETSQDIITSMTSHLVDTEREVAHELRSKQDQIDSAHAQLRECTALLTDERRKFTELQSQATARAERKHKIANLQRATLELRQKVAAIPSSSSPTRSPSTPLVNGQAPSGKTLPPLIALGDADANFTVPTPPTTPPSSSSSSPTNHTTHAYATSLPPVPTLRARLAAYTSNNTALRAQATQLRGRSAELETTYRRVVSLCTGVREDKVEELLTGLVAAVESERGGGVDMRRVREFMRRVEGVEG